MFEGNNEKQYSKLKRSERRFIEEPLQMPSGYVLDFSNRTIEEFFEDEFNIEFYAQKYAYNGASKAKIVRAILDSVSGSGAAKILRSLWNYRSTLPSNFQESDPDNEAAAKDNFFKVVSKLEGDESLASTDALTVFTPENSLSELVSAIERDIRADKPEVVLDRLHTYCMKKFSFLLKSRGETCSKEEPLHSRVGKFVKIAETDGTLTPMSATILKSSISIFEKFNKVRNDNTFAHDNQILQTKEARFIFDSVSAILRFIKAVDRKSFGE